MLATLRISDSELCHFIDGIFQAAARPRLFRSMTRLCVRLSLCQEKIPDMCDAELTVAETARLSYLHSPEGGADWPPKQSEREELEARRKSLVDPYNPLI